MRIEKLPENLVEKENSINWLFLFPFHHDDAAMSDGKNRCENLRLKLLLWFVFSRRFNY